MIDQIAMLAAYVLGVGSTLLAIGLKNAADEAHAENHDRDQ